MHSSSCRCAPGNSWRVPCWRCCRAVAAVIRSGPLQLAATLGIAAILLPVFFYDSDTPFPGLAALPAVLGTALLIWANGAGDLGSPPAGLATAGLVRSDLPIRCTSGTGRCTSSSSTTHWKPWACRHAWGCWRRASAWRHCRCTTSRHRSASASCSPGAGRCLARRCALAAAGSSSASWCGHYDGVPSRLSEEALRYAKASK